ncbi:hypothetical protein [Rubinisphaera italica]|uniref:Uncharacterized protein n=1 Tax=Rubinisphaera italica TaxID=2527969 RepID=A0A5C5X9T9_9PLAN|nr:hypothetical protein [Rubinisphaera italica]TWT59469.1 hypothetical protein Pan54_01750 [Rubinisphaera italica]
MANQNFHFKHNAHISPKPNPNRKISKTWSMLTAGLVFGLFGMYLTVTKPMTERMHTLESEIAMMQSEMHMLVGTRDDLWKTNDLLTGLRQQQRQMSEVQQSLASIRKMRDDVLALSSGQDVAMNTLDNLASMQTVLKTQSESIAQSQDSLAHMVSMNEHVVRLGKSANITRQDLLAADQVMADVQHVTERMSKQAEGMNEASMVLTAMDDLTNKIVAKKSNLEESNEILTKIDGLHAQIIKQQEAIPEAEQSLARMAALEAKLLEQNQEDLTKASVNLQEMMTFQKDLATDNTRITSAIQTVELLEDFQLELEHQAALLSNMRSELQEITILKSTVEDTLAVLKPLIQLSDLRRLSDVEVRDAARVILDRRIADGRSHKSSRIAEHQIHSPVMGPINHEGSETLKVPVPTDLE